MPVEANNSSLNNTKSDPFVANEPLGAIDIIALIQLSFVFIIGTIGNGFVIQHFGWNKKATRRPFSLLLLILGITDFLASLFVPMLFIYGTVTQFRQWHFGYFGCKIIQSLYPTTVSMSSGLLILISFERYRVIQDPFCENIRRRFIVSWLLVSVILSIVLVIPYMLSVELVTDNELHIYTCMPAQGNGVKLFIYALGNVSRDFSVTVIMIKFGVMSHKALKSNDKIREIKPLRRRLSNAAKARKMLIVVVMVFGFCVIPLDLFQLIVYSIFQAGYLPSVSEYQAIVTINTYFTVLQVSNSATNVLIYSKMQKDFFKLNVAACLTPRLHPTQKQTAKASSKHLIDDDDQFQFENNVFPEV